MRVNRGLLGWGVFFIVLGAVPLAVDRGLIDPDRLHGAWQLWPLILIGIGVGLVLARTRFAVLGGLIVAVTCGLMAGAVLAGDIGFPSGLTACATDGGTDGGTSFATRTGSFGADARVRLEMNCGELTVTSATGSAWTVSGTSDDGNPPDIAAVGGNLSVNAPDRSGVGVGAQGSRWQVSLPQDPMVDMAVSVNAGSADVRLGGMRLNSVDLAVNAGSATVDLTAVSGPGSFSGSVNAGSMSATLPAANMTGSLSVNAGSAELCVPAGVALRMTTGGNPLGTYDLEGQGLSQNGNTWTTPGFATATTRIDMELDANLGSITLNPENGCD
jgi:hypothetical protein